ncbi:hypothetical protein BX600DRAFT_198801 [Xylariales sp. PMI_506]|nr:hypothetical protein BX600DRAFT_198801 [Xylariales sp. PMI_506]
MSNHGAGGTSKPLAPSRPHHRISRSITETSAPRLHRHHHLLHHHHQQQQQQQQQQRRHQDRFDRVPQSAGPILPLPMRGSLDLPRSEGVTPYMLSSAEQSRRTSILLSGDDAGILGTTSTTGSKDNQTEGGTKNASLNIRGLSKSLTDLGAFSISTTRRLDDAYYAVLEKLSALQNTMVGVRELASMSQETNELFRTDSQGLVTEIDSQLTALGQFDEQQQRIESLQSRIHAGRHKVQALSERVDVVRERVESWERADREWQERTRKRLRVIWIITVFLVSILALLFIAVQYAPADVETVKGKLVGVMPNVSSTPLSRELINSSSGDSDGSGSRSSSILDNLGENVKAALNRSRDDGLSEGGDILHAFDEL